MTEKIDRLSVFCGGHESGNLFHDSQYHFGYSARATAREMIALGMPLRAGQYQQTHLFPVFQMNIPEGYVRRYISEKLMRDYRINDLLFLALSSDCGVGRLSYSSGDIERSRVNGIPLETILSWNNNETLFPHLVENYLLKTTAGFAGVQPKVVVPDERSSLLTPSLIVKSSDEIEWPGLAVNEYICMCIAKQAGLAVPAFWLSDNRQLFVMRRFDLLDDGSRLGVEDFSVLLNRPGDRKYEGSYENVMKVAAVYNLDATQVFRRIAVSLCLGDGDAHLKNFAVTYREPNAILQLSPAYDIVSTRVYGDTRIALSLKNNKQYPQYKDIIDFAEKFRVDRPQQVLTDIAGAAETVLDREHQLLKDYPAIRKAILISINETGIKPVYKSFRQ